jgi:transcriptional regulator with XRE-family HTH domain
MSEKEIARLKKLFGANLKKIRESKSLSLLEADYGSELNESNISKYENGKREPQLSTIFKLAKMLRIHPKELLDFGVDFTPESPSKESSKGSSGV